MIFRKDKKQTDRGPVVYQTAVAFISLDDQEFGIAEKGIMDIMITADGEEGHASMPPKNTAPGKLAKAIVAVEKNPFPARIIPTMRSFLRAIAPEIKGITGFILRHSGIFEFLIKKSFALSPTNNAMIRTTQAVTMLKGSEKENVLPKKASAVINIRILPGDTTESVLERIKRIISENGLSASDVEISGPVCEVIDRLIEAHRIELDKDSKKAVERIKEIALSFKDDLSSFLDTVMLERGIDHLQLKGDRVSLMTIHASKGLEWKVVFIIGLEDGIIPYRDAEKE